jgi:hypothetical protein
MVIPARNQQRTVPLTQSCSCPSFAVQRWTFPCHSQAEFLGRLIIDHHAYVIDFVGEPGGTRTRDPMIKSHVLYRLSYGLVREG